MVPPIRIHAANDRPIRPDGDYVLYWMLLAKRPTWNPALERAVTLARELDRPLLVLESLTCDYPWASDRLHRFVIEGMAANAAAFARTTARYVPWVEQARGQWSPLLQAVMQRACCVVSDDFPCFFVPRMMRRVAAQATVRLELVDGNGLFPLRASTKASERAVDFRRLLQRELRPHLGQFPLEDPLRGVSLPPLPRLPSGLVPADTEALLATGGLARLPIDHTVGAAPMRGGWQAAEQALTAFFSTKLSRYAEERSDIEADAASGLSPWLHFGHISVHRIMAELWSRESWSPDRLHAGATGSKEGWWGLSVAAESFIDELVTWRELGYHFCHHRPGDHDRYEALPPWALRTLELHAGDPRPHRYDLGQLRGGLTHDPLWNAAQRQLVAEGRMPNYLRMLWGKKILEWSRHPQEALAAMIELNNRYAVDGRDPNSYSGIMWCLGRFDRPWAPERPIFGMIRYMSSDNTARKMRVKPYIATWTADSGAHQLDLFGDAPCQPPP